MNEAETPRRVEVPFSPSRAFAPALAPLTLFVVIGAVTVLISGNLANWFQAVAFLGVAGATVGTAWRQRRWPALALDSDGVHGPNDGLLVGWADVAAAWVGHRTPRWLPDVFRSPTVRIWTHAGVAFGQRARYRPTPRVSQPLRTRMTPSELAALLTRYTAAPVYRGDQTKLRDLERRLVARPDETA